MVELAELHTDNEDLLKRNPELAAMLKVKPKRSKYGNHRVVIDNEVYDSGKEASDAGKFKLAVQAGAYLLYIHHFTVALPGNINMELDHVLINSQMQIEVFDSKSTDGEATVTRVWTNKKKLFESTYHIPIQII